MHHKPNPRSLCHGDTSRSQFIPEQRQTGWLQISMFSFVLVSPATCLLPLRHGRLWCGASCKHNLQGRLTLQAVFAIQLCVHVKQLQEEQLHWQPLASLT